MSIEYVTLYNGKNNFTTIKNITFKELTNYKTPKNLITDKDDFITEIKFGRIKRFTQKDSLSDIWDFVIRSRNNLTKQCPKLIFSEMIEDDEYITYFVKKLEELKITYEMKNYTVAMFTFHENSISITDRTTYFFLQNYFEKLDEHVIM